MQLDQDFSKYNFIHSFSYGWLPGCWRMTHISQKSPTRLRWWKKLQTNASAVSFLFEYLVAFLPVWNGVLLWYITGGGDPGNILTTTQMRLFEILCCSSHVAGHIDLGAISSCPHAPCSWLDTLTILLQYTEH